MFPANPLPSLIATQTSGAALLCVTDTVITLRDGGRLTEHRASYCTEIVISSSIFARERARIFECGLRPKVRRQIVLIATVVTVADSYRDLRFTDRIVVPLVVPVVDALKIAARMQRLARTIRDT